jgi:hypothetical protein
LQTWFRQLQLRRQRLRCSAGLASSSEPMFIERDFSSFIIGDGVVTAFFMLDGEVTQHGVVELEAMLQFGHAFR